MDFCKIELILEKVNFDKIISDLIINEKVLMMKKFMQHCDKTTFDHCMEVAFITYKICKKINLDYVSATRGAMLHDLFLYDWREKSSYHRLHAFKHGMFALNNAEKEFHLNAKEKDIIKKHMWPLIVIPPKSIEGFIVSFVDKYCAMKDIFDYYEKVMINKKMYRYASNAIIEFGGRI